jgi:FAD/FMN-containing dehydrogenase
MNAIATNLFIFPDDVRWDDARRALSLAPNQRPAAVARPASVEDVVAAVTYARERDLEIAVQSSGEGAADSSLAGTLLIDLRELAGALRRR